MTFRELKRVELKAIKKDLLEQLSSGVETDSLYIKGFITYGDGVYEGGEDCMRFGGRLTKQETDGRKVIDTAGLIISTYEDGSVEVSVHCRLEDELGYRDLEWVTLNI